MRPDRTGISVPVDPYDDVEIYKIDIEDKIVEVITLSDTPKRKTEETSSQKVTNPPAKSAMLITSTSKQENYVMMDIISQNIAKDYVV